MKPVPQPKFKFGDIVRERDGTFMFEVWVIERVHDEGMPFPVYYYGEERHYLIEETALRAYTPK